ncbi:hypothetical protein PMIN03_005570 [Paraphaeosphaeria minitans]
MPILQIYPASFPSIPTPLKRFYIFFRHPGYDDSNNVLLKLHASDTNTDRSHDGEPSPRPGLYAQVALDACAIIAGNCNDGWLSPNRDSEQARNNRVAASSMLHARSYYFHLNCVENTDECDEPYPIVPTFREWCFPHDRVPAHWAQLSSNTTSLTSTFAPSNLTAALQACSGGGRCHITGHKEEIQVAHIVPQAELDWWLENDMSRYNNGRGNTLDDTVNAMLLQADLHIAFDKSRFVFVPKPSSEGGEQRLVFHLLDPSPEYEHYHHNHELHESAVSPEVLFARFAWTLFPLLGAFLSCKKNRRLTLRTATDNQVLARGYFPASVCGQFSQLSFWKRSQSPKKRKPDADVLDAASVGDAAVYKQIRENTPASALNVRKRALRSDDNEVPLMDLTRGRSKRRKVLACPSPSSPSPLSSMSPTENSSSACHAKEFCATAVDHSQLAQQWLDSERQRSDPGQNWIKEKRWAQEVWAGKSLASHEVGQWLELSGYDVRDAGSDHEVLCANEVPIDCEQGSTGIEE